MKEWFDWLNSFYFFQFLALTAFCLGSISVTNSIFSLKDRLRKWMGLKSKESVEKQLESLKPLITQIRSLRHNPDAYIGYVVKEFISSVLSLLYSSIVFLVFGCVYLAFHGLFVWIPLITFLGIVIALFFFVRGFRKLANLLMVAELYYNPFTLSTKIHDLLYLAEEKQYELPNRDETLKLLRAFPFESLSDSWDAKTFKIVDNKVELVEKPLNQAK